MKCRYPDPDQVSPDNPLPPNEDCPRCAEEGCLCEVCWDELDDPFNDGGDGDDPE
jgi:hypothetical protein